MIYWDHSATTPCAQEVVEAMQPFWNHEFGNPSSPHYMGRKASAAVKKAREQVSSLAGCFSDEIVFTSGATESNNLLFLGILLTKELHRRKIVISAIEHKSVLEPVRLLENYGFEIEKLPVTSNGVTDPKAASDLIDSNTLLVSVQAVNNELGTMQPIACLSQLAHESGAFFHTDAAQALGKIPFDVDDVCCDFASFSSHKMYGPKGIGGLYIKGGVRQWPWIHPFQGGDQEWKLRPGTSNVPAIVGFGKASEIAKSRMSSINGKLRRLADKFCEELRSTIPNAYLINNLDESIPGAISVVFPGVHADMILAHSGRINLSRTSACNGALGPSHVIREVLESTVDHESVVRITFGDSSQSSDIQEFLRIVKKLSEGGESNEFQ